MVDQMSALMFTASLNALPAENLIVFATAI